eukprot:GHVP01068383.1.p1 GENE.GHVP01068383.1~~GHVP01068383.1.p1  ORF type:complete len:774 (+),score=119.50 GHVP01068383.1:179-2500(+)
MTTTVTNTNLISQVGCAFLAVFVVSSFLQWLRPRIVSWMFLGKTPKKTPWVENSDKMILRKTDFFVSDALARKSTSADLGCVLDNFPMEDEHSAHPKPKMETGISNLSEISTKIGLEDYSKNILSQSMSSLTEVGLQPSFSDELSNCSPHEIISLVYEKSLKTLLSLTSPAKIDLLRLPAKLARNRQLADANTNFLATVSTHLIEAHEAESFWSELSTPENPEEDQQEILKKLSFAAWGCAKCGYENRSLFSWFEKILFTAPCEIDITCSSMMLWAFGKMGQNTNAKFINFLCDNAIKHFSNATDQNIANIFYSLAIMGLDYPKLTREAPQHVHNHIVESLPAFNPQALSNFIWSFAHFGRVHPDILSVAQEAARCSCVCFKPQELSNTMWAFAKLNTRNPEVIRSLANRAYEIMDQFNVQELSNIYWSIGTLEFTDSLLTPKFFDLDNTSQEIIASDQSSRIYHTFRENLPAFTPQAVANVAWSFARLKWRPIKILQMLVQTSVTIPHSGHWKPQNISNFVWALAKLRVPDILELKGPILLEWFDNVNSALYVFLPAAIEIIGKFKPQEIANLVWGVGQLRLQLQLSIQSQSDRLKFSRRLEKMDQNIQCIKSVDKNNLQILCPLLLGFKPQEISLFLQGMKALDWKNNLLLTTIESQITKKRNCGLSVFEAAKIIPVYFDVGGRQVDLLLSLFLLVAEGLDTLNFTCVAAVKGTWKRLPTCVHIPHGNKTFTKIHFLFSQATNDRRGQSNGGFKKKPKNELESRVLNTMIQ